MQARGTARRPSCTWWATTRRLGTAARRAAGAHPAPPATPRAALHTAGSSGTSKTCLPSSSSSFPARDGMHAMRRVLQFRCCAVTSAPCCPPGMRVCLWGARVEDVPRGAAEVPSANLCWGSAVGNRPQNVRLDCGRELRRAQSCERCGATCAPHPPLFGEFSQHTARVPGGDSFRCLEQGRTAASPLFATAYRPWMSLAVLPPHHAPACMDNTRTCGKWARCGRVQRRRQGLVCVGRVIGAGAAADVLARVDSRGQAGLTACCAVPCQR